MNNSSAKTNNRSNVLSAIMAQQPVSRKELAQLLSISPAAVTHIVDDLISSGLVVEGDFGQASIRGGRRPINLRICEDGGLVLAAVFRLHGAQIAVCDMMGKELLSRNYDVSFDSTEELVETLAADMAEMMEQAGGRERFAGVGASVPGTVEANRILYAPELGLVEYDLAGILEEKLGVPVYMDKDVYLIALGENWMGAGWDYSDFVVVTIGTGIGSAVIINNQIHRGHCGMAGEIGYLVTGPGALESGPYHVTDFGYFEKNASLQALKQTTGLSLRHIVREAQTGDDLLRRALFQNADSICLGLASVISLLNPQAVILHGSYAAAEHLVADYIRQKLKDLTPVPCDVKFSHLGSRALILGCVGKVWRRAYQMQFLPRHQTKGVQ